MSTSDQNQPSSPWNVNSPTAAQRRKAREHLGTFNAGTSAFQVWLATSRPQIDGHYRCRGAALYAAFLSSQRSFARSYAMAEAHHAAGAAIQKAQGPKRNPKAAKNVSPLDKDDACPF